MDRPMELSQQAKGRIPKMGTQSAKIPAKRLYPVLPNLDRCECVELNHSDRDQLNADTVDSPHRSVEDTQPEMSATDGVNTMKEQIAILEKQRREIIAINQKWAEQYESMTRYYKEKIQRLKTLHSQHGHHQTEEERGEGEERHNVLETDLSQIKDREESAQLLEAEQEAEQLRAQNSSLTRRGQRQHKEIQRLNKALEEALQTPAHVEEVSPETQEEVWKHQAQVYKEDFLKERRDREKLKGKHLQLEQRFIKVHSALQTLNAQVIWTPTLPRPTPECTCTHRAHTPPQEGTTYPRAHANTQHHCEPQPRKPHS